MPLPFQFALVILAGWINRQQCELIDSLQAENRVLGEQLGARRLRFTEAQRRRLGRHAHPTGRRRLREISTIVTPDTLLRWYRKLVAQKYDGSAKRGPGRPRVAPEIEQLGETSLKAHWGAIAATDFFTVEVVTWKGLVRYFVLFVIDLETRRVDIAGISPNPNALWMGQMARNLTDVEAGFLNRCRYLIHDRDPLFTAAFSRTLSDSGVECVKLPPRSPNLHAYAERFVRSIKSECLGRIIPIGEARLRRAVREYAQQYHHERNHQGLENELIDPEDDLDRPGGRIECRERLGGLLRYYRRAA